MRGSKNHLPQRMRAFDIFASLKRFKRQVKRLLANIIPIKSINPNFGRTRNNNGGGYNRATTLTQFPGRDLAMGVQDPVKQEVVR